MDLQRCCKNVVRTDGPKWWRIDALVFLLLFVLLVSAHAEDDLRGDDGLVNKRGRKLGRGTSMEAQMLSRVRNRSREEDMKSSTDALCYEEELSGWECNLEPSRLSSPAKLQCGTERMRSMSVVWDSDPTTSIDSRAHRNNKNMQDFG